MTDLSEFVVVSGAVLARASFFIFGRRRVKTERHAQSSQTCSAVGFELDFEYKFLGKDERMEKGAESQP